MPVMAFLLIATFAAIVSISSYRTTRFSYVVGEHSLTILMRVWGIVPRKKNIPYDQIVGVRRLLGVWEVLPIVCGNFPSLWGRYAPSRMLVIERTWQPFPVMITPDNPEQLFEQLTAATARHRAMK
jgi:hypothetical protein